MECTYEANATIPLAETCIEFLEDGIGSPARVVLALSPTPDIRFELLVDSPAIHRVLVDRGLENKPVVVELPTGLPVSVIPYGSTLVPLDSDISGIDTGEALHSVRFGLINFPDFMKQGFTEPYTSADGRQGFQVSRTVQLTGNPWLIEIRAVHNRKQIQKSLSGQHGFGLTHWGSIRRNDGKAFSKEAVQTLISALGLFLSFARGSYCGITLVKGLDHAGEPAWENWGVSNVEPWEGHRSWFDSRNGRSLEDVFPGFWIQYQDYRQDGRTRIALEWYLESNAQKALHSSIVLTQAALERLTYVRVGRKLSGRHLGRKDSEKVGEWIARALADIRVDCQIPRSYVELEHLRSVNGFAHGPHTLVKIRDDLIHEEMRHDILSAEVYSQARELGLWYVEMLLLKLFNYNGLYGNRLTQQWRGQVEVVPWAP